MARVVRFHKTGGPEVLKIEQLDVPPPGKGEVQISALTRIWTSPFPGGGTSSCSIFRTSGPPVLWNRTTRAMAFSC